MGFWSKVPPAPPKQKAPIMRVPEIMMIIAPWLLYHILQRIECRAADAYAQISIFRERGVQNPHSIGMALGKPGFGLELYRINSVVPSYENACRVLANYDDHVTLAKTLGLADANDLLVLVVNFGRVTGELDNEQFAAAATTDLDMSPDEVLEAAAALPPLTLGGAGC